MHPMAVWCGLHCVCIVLRSFGRLVVCQFFLLLFCAWHPLTLLHKLHHSLCGGSVAHGRLPFLVSASALHLYALNNALHVCSGLVRHSVLRIAGDAYVPIHVCCPQKSMLTMSYVNVTLVIGFTL